MSQMNTNEKEPINVEYVEKPNYDMEIIKKLSKELKE